AERPSSHSVTCSEEARRCSSATGSGPVTRSDGAAIPATALNRICTCRPSTVWKAHPRSPFGSETGFPATAHSSMCEPATTGLLAGRRSKDWSQNCSDASSAVAEQGSRTWLRPSPRRRTRGCGNGARTLNRSVRAADGILAIHCLERLLALTGFGWTVPGLGRIVLHVEPWNIASQRTAERAGYVRQEATADHRIFNGETREMVVYEAVRP